MHLDANEIAPLKISKSLLDAVLSMKKAREHAK